MTDDRSEGGSRILHHTRAQRSAGVAEVDAEVLAAIEAHVKRFVGEPAHVFHEIVSDIVHLDVHIVAPSAGRNCYTLFTTGMSALPMSAPPGADEFRYAELMLSLPASWTKDPLWEANLEDESLYWPIRLLKTLARLPHEYGTWLGFGHTVPNGDPALPYAPNTELCCATILVPVTADADFATLNLRPDKTIHFYAVVPIHESEMQLKLNKGTDALIDALDRAGVTDLVD
ncbi:MAG: suppressor of fused domain protein, partial [Deltaproteobacteria bacterium]|nr:suppressor of fused domain protein [Deltaproteobacteria bacterium]